MTSTSGSTTVAYFSMEICLEQGIPTYSGGLGILSGDTLRSAADLGAPVVGITLLHRQGYFEQHIDAEGNQTEAHVRWSPEKKLEPVDARASVLIEGRHVQVRAWRYTIRGVSGREVPVYLLDTQLPENGDYDRTLTDRLYGGDGRYRLCQEVVLGMGGAALLRQLGLNGAIHYHLNEGHSALLTLCLLQWQLESRSGFRAEEDDLEQVRKRVVFTTHTPVPAGHDKFPLALVKSVLGDAPYGLLQAAELLDEHELNMTHLVLRLSRFVNGVAMKHREVSQGMFPTFPIDSITNGVHAATWTSPSFAKLFDKRIPEWRSDNLYLRYAVGIPLQEIRAAHAEAKKDMIAAIAERSGVTLDPKVFTVGFARRATPYKRADLLFSDPKRLAQMASAVGPFQVVFGGKAHPNDGGGKELIKRIHEAAAAIADSVKVVYVENYEMEIAAQIV